MKVICPTCSQPVPAEDIALDTGWAKCRRCNEVFELADLLSGYTPPGAKSDAALVPERPFDAWAITERTADALKIHLPAQGMRSATWGMLFFALFWLAFVAFWTAGALGVFFGGNNAGIQPGRAIFAAFSIPFWLVGIGMMVGILWSSRGTRTVYIDSSWLLTELRCMFWRRRRTIDRSQVQFAREGEAKVTSGRSGAQSAQVFAEIVFTRGSFALPSSTAAERVWLIGLVNDFLKTVPYRAPAFADPPAIDSRAV